MKKFRKALAMLLAVASVLSLSSGVFAATWTDVPKGSWYESYVNTVVEAGLMNGTGDNKFSPDVSLSRGMFVTILNRAVGNTEVASSTVFSDVQKNAWYDRSVQWAESQGIVNGYTDGRFGVTDPLTREQMATILHRYAKAQGKDVSVGENTNILSYDDASAVEYMGMKVKIVEGDERNIKVTTPMDLKIAEMLLEEMK